MISERYTPHTLQRWTLPEYYAGSEWPEYYAGSEWPEYYVFLGQHRYSDCITRSNFISGLDAIGGESETVHVVVFTPDELRTVEARHIERRLYCLGRQLINAFAIKSEPT